MEFPNDPVAQEYYDYLIEKDFGPAGTLMFYESMKIHAEHYGKDHTGYYTYLSKAEAALYRHKELKTFELLGVKDGGDY